MSTPPSNGAQRKTYTSYATDRAALARLVKAGKKTQSNYKEADAIRDALLEKDERVRANAIH